MLKYLFLDLILPFTCKKKYSKAWC